MQIAQKRDAVLSEKFYSEEEYILVLASSWVAFECWIVHTQLGLLMRQQWLHEEERKEDEELFPAPPKPVDGEVTPVEEEYELMTIKEIMTGKVGCSQEFKKYLLRLTANRMTIFPG